MNSLKRFLAYPLGRAGAVATLISMLVGAGQLGGAHPVARVHAATGGCQLGSAGNIQHVIYIQFDNVHLTRDIPNVPSDLEFMPHLLSFITSNGVMLSNHHTPLISHTSEDILTSLTGLYPNHHGVAVGQNSYQYYTASGSPRSFTTAFTYWSDKIGNGTYNMLSAPNTNAPAPWVPFTRAGCSVGGVASANQVLENANVSSPFGANDISTVFGLNSPESKEQPAARRTADFVGIAVHCGQADTACAGATGAVTDTLPNEPGGYTGFNALYGHKYVSALVSPNNAITDINGNPVTASFSDTAASPPAMVTVPGFPGFDGMNAATSLGYVAAMQEHGVPVTYAYISDAHDDQSATSHTAFGPGEVGYVAQLRAYDDAFNKFFTRLTNDGITTGNTLFVFTADENDHFTGGPPSPANCDGTTIPCTYVKTPTNPTTPPGPPFGEIATGLDGLLARQGVTAPGFTVGNDTAPGVYLNGNPGPTDPGTRSVERAAGAITVVNPLTNNTEPLAQYLADPVEMNLLHMVTADPARTPTFTIFARPGYYVTGTCSGGYDSSSTPTYSPSCVIEKPAYAWLHGNVQQDVSTTWLGLAGAGVQHLGLSGGVWSDHTDIRPTMLALLGLRDDYAHDGRALFEVLNDAALPQSLVTRRATLRLLAYVYKQLTAPVAWLGLTTLRISTAALKSNASGDATYTGLDGRLAAIGAQRDAIAGQMAALLEGATFNNRPINVVQADRLIAQGYVLLLQTTTLAAGL